MKSCEFDLTRIEEEKARYAEELNAAWSSMDAFMQSQEKTAKYTDEDWNVINDEMEQLHIQFSEVVKKRPSSKKVQRLVESLQKHITKYYYDCPKEMFSKLGKSLATDQKSIMDIDQYGKGTAKFMSKAIAVYCR